MMSERKFSKTLAVSDGWMSCEAENEGTETFLEPKAHISLVFTTDKKIIENHLTFR